MTRNQRSRRRPQRERAVVDELKRISEQLRVPLGSLSSSMRDPIFPVIKPKIWNLVRVGTGPDIGVLTTGSSFGAFAINVNSLFDTSSEVTENFRFFRLLCVEVAFIPVTQIVGSGVVSGGAIANWGDMETVTDPQDASTPVSHAELQQYDTLYTCRTGTPFTRTWYPSAAIDVATSGGTGIAVSKPTQWMSALDLNVLYRGVRYGVGQSAGTGNVTVYTTRIKGLVQCKGRK